MFIEPVAQISKGREQTSQPTSTKAKSRCNTAEIFLIWLDEIVL